MRREANSTAPAVLGGRSAKPARAGTKTPAPSPAALKQCVGLPGWVRIVLAVGLFKIAAAASVVLSTPGGKPPAAYLLTVCAFAMAGTWLMTFGRGDRRAVSLGIFFLLVASSFTGRLFLSAAEGAPAVAPALRFLTRLTVEAYQPFFFWLFVRDFPRARRIVRASSIHRREEAAKPSRRRAPRPVSASSTRRCPRRRARPRPRPRRSGR